MISASMKAPQLDKSTSRDQLLKAAGALMAERGTIDVSLSAIARKSGLNSALVGYYFGSKNGLLLSLVKDVLGKGLRQLDGLLKMDLDPIDKLKLHVKAIINVYFRYPYINRLIHHMLEDRELGREVAETISKPLADAQCRLLQEGVASGHFKPIDAMMFHFIILGACDQLFFGRHILRSAFGIDEIDDKLRLRYTDTVLDVVLNGVLAKSPSTS
jgi:TetR/AcrR family transcriptional regulator